MQMYISAPPQGFQYPPPNHGNSQQPAPPFTVPGTTYQSMPHPPMPPQGGYPMPCAPNVQPFMMPPQQPHNQVCLLKAIEPNLCSRLYSIVSNKLCSSFVFDSHHRQTMSQCNSSGHHRQMRKVHPQ